MSRENLFDIPRIEPDDIDEYLSVRDPEFPDRPRHEDFVALAKLMVHLDNYAEDNGMEGVMASVAQVADPKSVEYIAVQRAMRYAMAQNASLFKDQNLLMSWLWREAFIIGVQFERTRRG